MSNRRSRIKMLLLFFLLITASCRADEPASTQLLSLEQIRDQISYPIIAGIPTPDAINRSIEAYITQAGASDVFTRELTEILFNSLLQRNIDGPPFPSSWMIYLFRHRADLPQANQVTVIIEIILDTLTHANATNSELELNSFRQLRDMLQDRFALSSEEASLDLFESLSQEINRTDQSSSLQDRIISILREELTDELIEHVSIANTEADLRTALRAADRIGLNTNPALHRALVNRLIAGVTHSNFVAFIYLLHNAENVRPELIRSLSERVALLETIVSNFAEEFPEQINFTLLAEFFLRGDLNDVSIQAALSKQVLRRLLDEPGTESTIRTVVRRLYAASLAEGIYYNIADLLHNPFLVSVLAEEWPRFTDYIPAQSMIRFNAGAVQLPNTDSQTREINLYLLRQQRLNQRQFEYFMTSFLQSVVDTKPRNNLFFVGNVLQTGIRLANDRGLQHLLRI